MGALEVRAPGPEEIFLHVLLVNSLETSALHNHALSDVWRDAHRHRELHFHAPARHHFLQDLASEEDVRNALIAPRRTDLCASDHLLK